MCTRNKTIIFRCESLMCRKNLQHDFVLNHMIPLYTLPCCFFKPYCNILPFTPSFSKQFLSFRVCYQNVLCISVLCIFPPKKLCRILWISQCYKFVFSGAFSTQSNLFHVGRNNEVYAKYCTLHRTFTVLFMSLWSGMFLLILSLTVFHVYWIPCFSQCKLITETLITTHGKELPLCS